MIKEQVKAKLEAMFSSETIGDSIDEGIYQEGDFIVRFQFHPESRASIRVEWPVAGYLDMVDWVDGTELAHYLTEEDIWYEDTDILNIEAKWGFLDGTFRGMDPDGGITATAFVELVVTDWMS